MPNQPRTPVRGVRISDTLWHRALAAARRNGETVSDVVRQALEKYVAKTQRRT